MPRPRPQPATPFGVWLDGWLTAHPEYTLQEFGRQVGVTKSAVSLWITKPERTKIPIPRLREVSRVTGEPVENLEVLVYGADVVARGRDGETRYIELKRPGGASPTFTLTAFEKQVDHRIDIEKRAIRWDIVRSFVGIILGFIVAMTIVIGSFLLILDGHTDQGAAGIIATLVTIVGVFVYSDVTRRRERSKKAGR